MSLPKSTVQRESEKFVEDASGDVTVRTTTSASALPSGASTEAKQDNVITGIGVLNSLIPDAYDYISLGYTGDNLTTVVFKTGGSGGSAVSTLTLAYTGSQLDSVTKT